jgi:hypothetical protein
MAEKKTYKELEERIIKLEHRLKGSSNREYKSRLFGFILWTLSLDNAIHGTSYNDLSASLCMPLSCTISFSIRQN